jgi:hypothetical protein
MDAHIAELVGTDGASMYGSFGGGAAAVPTTVTGPSGSFSFGNASSGADTGWALIAAVVLLVFVYVKTRGVER